MAKVYTFTGWFDIAAPEFNAEDIAHGLATINCFGGAGKHFVSAAEHSLLVAGLMAELKLGDPFEGLLSDAAVAYVGDIRRPYRERWTTATEDTQRIEIAIRDKFKLPLQKTEGCAKAVKLARAIEAHFLLWDKGADMDDTREVRTQVGELIKDHWKVHGFEPQLAEHLWMKGFKHYGPPQIELPSKEIVLPNEL